MRRLKGILSLHPVPILSISSRISIVLLRLRAQLVLKLQAGLARNVKESLPNINFTLPFLIHPCSHLPFRLETVSGECL